MSITESDFLPLTEVKNPRDFLKAILQLRERSGRKFSFSQLARAAGFTSRSYPREVLTGRRRLTPKSSRAFSKGLRLQPLLAERLELLSEIAYSKKIEDTLKLEKLLSFNRDRLLQASKPTVQTANFETAFQNPVFSILYASLGSCKNGSSLTEICKRSKLSINKVKSLLIELEQQGLIIKKGLRYFAETNHIVAPSMKTGSAFHQYYLNRLNLAQQKAKNTFVSDSQLFWESTISVSTEQLPQLKIKLRELLLKFTEEAETAEGDSIISISTAMFDPRES